MRQNQSPKKKSPETASLEPEHQSGLRRFWPFTVMGFIWAFCWWPVLMGQRQFYMRDLTFYALPMKTFMLERLQAGGFPFWFPHVSTGMPFFAEPSHQVLYPFNLLFFLAPTPVHGISWFVVLHLLLAQFAMYGLCRTLGISKWLSLWGGLLFGYAGYTLSITDNVNYLPAVFWAPLTLAVFIQGLKTASLRFSALTALCVACMLLAGDTFNPLFLGIFCTLLTLGCWRLELFKPWNGAGNRHRWFIWAHWFLSFSLAALLIAVQALPTLELLELSVRKESLHYDEVTLWSIPPHRLVELIQPYFYGSKYPSPHFIGQFMYPQFREPWADSFYIGLIPMLFGLLALIKSPSRSAFWIGIVTISLLVGLGYYAPYNFEFLLQIFPPLSRQRYLEKSLFFIIMGLTVMSVLGADCFFRNREALIRRFSGKPLWAKIFWTVFWVCGGTIFLLKIPVDLWIWPHAMEDSREWHGHFYHRGPHVEGLYRHWWMVLFPVILLPWLKARWQTRYAVFLMVFSVINLMVVHWNKVPTAPTELIASRPTPQAYEIIRGDQPDGPIRILFDDKADYVDEQDEPITLGRIKKTFGLDSLTDNFPYYWVYRFLYSQSRLLFNYGIIYDAQYQNGRFEPLQQKRHKLMDDILWEHKPELLAALCAAPYIITSDHPTNELWRNKKQLQLLGARPDFNLQVLKVTDAVPRAYLAPSAIYNTESESVYKILTKGFLDYDYRRQAEIEADKPNRANGEPPLPLDSRAQVSILRDQPERIELEVNSTYSSPDTHLVLVESMFPGWQATVDGKPSPIYLANHRFMAVPIQAGKHQVVFTYTSTWFSLGLLLSMLGVLLTLGVLLAPEKRVTFR